MKNPFTLVSSQDKPKQTNELERIECPKHGVVLYGLEVVMTPYRNKNNWRWLRDKPTKKVLICPECHALGVFTEIAE